MAPQVVVCFHHRRRCSFCGIPGGKPAQVRLRCACCGRFRKRSTCDEDRCPVCTHRGFVALRLAI